jgi:hypothetical protein
VELVGPLRLISRFISRRLLGSTSVSIFSAEAIADTYRATTFLLSPRPILTLEWKVLTTRTHLLSDLQPVSPPPELELSLNESLSSIYFLAIIELICRIFFLFPPSCF